MTATKLARATKSAHATVKAVGDDGAGVFEALVSVFGNVDSFGDVVMPGAFTATLEDWRTKGRPIPVVWSHEWDDPFSIIGAVDEARETDAGLVVKATLDLDNPKAVQVYRLLMAGTVAQFSFAFDIDDAGWGVRTVNGVERDVYELRRLSLTEVGPCLRGVNKETELLALKGEPPARTSTAERKAEDKGSATPGITADAALAWAFTNDPEGGAA